MRSQTMFGLGLLLACLISKSEAQLAASPLYKVATDERASRDLHCEPCDTNNFKNCYDFIIVGAGAAGAVLANRLTEDPNITVLLIEAGQPEPIITAVPSYAFDLRKTDIDWDFITEPDPGYCLGMTNERCVFPRGKVMGGSTTINNAIHQRGNRRDYDLWAAMGNPGWDFKSVLPYFKKLEKVQILAYSGNTAYRGFTGPLDVGRTYTPPLAPVFIEAGGKIGWPINQDFNGPTQVGLSYPQSIVRDGARLSSSRAYLCPISHRKNLHVTKFSRVTKINFKSLTEANGVTFSKNNTLFSVRAEKEVLLCAGTIQSPQLLMLSGIGPKSHLEQLGISPIRADLPVGENLTDHMAVVGITFDTNIPNSNTSMDDLVKEWRTNRTGPLTYSGAMWALLDTMRPSDPDGWCDVEVVFLLTDNNPQVLMDVQGISLETYNVMYPQPSQDRILLHMLPFLMRPKSRGAVRLNNTDPFSPPLIYPGYWTDPDDIKTVIRGVRQIMKLAEALSINVTLRTYSPDRCELPPYMSDEYIECLCRELPMTIYHYASTCGMGRVVDHKLRVKGIKRLRVVDASAMPVIPSGHTMTPTYMMAEKAADMIKDRWNIGT